MDRSWMNEHRLSTRYLNGVKEFITFAFRNPSGGGKIMCPCVKCKNNLWVTREEAVEHLFCDGFMKGYTTWMAHGEASSSNVDTGNVTRVDDDFMQHDMISMLHDRFVVVDSDDIPDDTTNIGDEGPNEEAKEFYRLLKEAEKELYPGCQKYSTLSFLVELFNIKCLGKWSDHSFNMLLDLLKKTLPVGETLPKSYYEMKKEMGSLKLSYNKIDACPNDCMLYWKEHENDSECQVCHKSRWVEEEFTNNDASSSKKKRVAAKVLRHFPLIPRLQQLFMSSKTSSLMKWHNESRTKDGCMRHPADSPAWQMFDYKHREFASDARNVRLGLATDGFNPFRTLSSTCSTWPVVLMPYNLPPWLCMKEPYLILSLLIPGQSAPGNNLDVYLQPLIEELKILWEDGVQTYDESTHNNFQMRAALLWTISDFPAYAYLSGWSTKGALACPSCHRYTYSRWLVHSKKHCYMGHRCFLDDKHPFRKNKRLFDGTEDYRKPPHSLTGTMVLDDLRGFDYKFGKEVKDNPKLPYNYKKRSIFFDLAYWKHNLVRHCLDVMHIEKNVCDKIVGTLLNSEGTKDHYRARLDLEDMGIRPHLHPKKTDSNRVVLPASLFTMDKKEKDIFCKVLKRIKVPDGYSSNISRCVHLKSHKIFGLKSHDNHILMQQILPLALRRVLPKKVRSTLIDLCTFFRELCSKVLRPRELIKLETQIAKTLCDLETIFPPSFFDIMVHLPVHLANEARLAGPVQYRWMYPIERYLGTLKSYVRNRSHPEGSIAEGYLAQECSTFCSRYLDDVETKFNRVRRNDDGDNSITVESPIFSMPGRSFGAESITILDKETMEKAHRYVLFNCESVNPFIIEHQNVIRIQNPRRRPRDVSQIQNKEFASWFSNHVTQLFLAGNDQISEELRNLAQGPNNVGKTFKGFTVNGFRFHVKELELRRKYQNSGVMTTAMTTSFSSVRDINPISDNMTYYGILKDIVELEYIGGKKIVLFKCDWVTDGRRKRQDELGFTLVNFSNLPDQKEPFVLASQVQQVFYAEDPIDKGWNVVIKTKARDTFDMNAELEIEDMVRLDEVEGSSVHVGDEDVEINWVREDVDALVVEMLATNDLA